MIPAYALLRRSTSAPDLSIEQQREAVHQWATDHGYHIVREFSDDASGLDTARRKGFRALPEVCEDKRHRTANTVLTYDVSRFSRLDPDEATYHEYSLKLAGVTVIYTHDPGVNEPGMGGRLLKHMKKEQAHEYSLKLSQLVRRGQRAHAALGHWIGGSPPFGYRRALLAQSGPQVLVAGRRKARGESVVLVIDPVEALIVVEIFELYVAGLGIQAIVQRLNERDVPPPASHRRGGMAAWSKSCVWSILRNPVYRGALVFGKARYREIGKKSGKRAVPCPSTWSSTALSPRSYRGSSGNAPRRSMGPAVSRSDAIRTGRTCSLG